MKFTIKNSLFTAIVSELHKICSNKSLLPILSGIKIEATDAGVVLTGGNSELFIADNIVKSHKDILEEFLSEHYTLLSTVN